MLGTTSFLWWPDSDTPSDTWSAICRLIFEMGLLDRVTDSGSNRRRSQVGNEVNRRGNFLGR